MQPPRKKPFHGRLEMGSAELTATRSPVSRLQKPASAKFDPTAERLQIGCQNQAKKENPLHHPSFVVDL